MSAWIVGKTYRLFGRDVGLKRISRRGNGRARGWFVGDDSFSAWVYLDTLQPPSTVVRAPIGADVSLRITFDAQRARDAIAEAQATLLAEAGWYCISGKHLKIARARVVGKYLERLSPEDAADVLRRALARKNPHVAEVKTVDVDTYVALKKLRRREREARIDPAKDEAASKHLKYMGVVQRNESFDSSVYQDAVINAVRRSAGEVMMPRGAGKAATSPRRPRPAEVRYVNSLRALPDSLYKRTQLRYMRLPKAASRDHAARKKAFDREVAKYNKEKPQ